MASNTKSDTSWQTKWTKCCLCQAEKKEPLTSPVANPARRTEDGYSLLGKNIPLFHVANALPIKIDLQRFDDGTGIESTPKKKESSAVPYKLQAFVQQQ